MIRTRLQVPDDFGQNVRAQNDGVLAAERVNELADIDDLFGVEPGGGLVEDQHVGAVNQRLRQPDALPVAAREMADDLVPHVPERATLQHGVDAAGDLGAGDSLQPRHEVEKLDDFHFGVERRSFGQIADPLLHLEGLLGHVESGDGGLAQRGGQEPGQDPHRGGLAGAIRPEKADNFAAVDIKADVVDRNRRPVAFGQTLNFNHGWMELPDAATAAQLVKNRRKWCD